MSKLSVQTRGNSIPRENHGSIYAAIPGFCPLLCPLRSDLSASQNRAIHYQADWNTPLDGVDQLADMRLFLTLLAVRFLAKPNRARTVEYGFGISRRRNFRRHW